MNRISINPFTCLFCLVLFLLCACNETPKQGTTSEPVKTDTSGTRGEEEKMEIPAPGADSSSESSGESVSAEALELKLYPNPARGNFNLELSRVDEGMEYQVVSNEGRTVLQGDVSAPKENIDISELKNGVYIVKVLSADKKSQTVSRLSVYQ